ncbi:SAM-dependent methyltransferase [Streptomyces spiroverticillatus]|uniref:SAM-dependent methyltransferase n=1 Tax=Streptomyces finlayi TaxID=67296 RepID=A0A918WWL1_9ACTN|nr:class I SAM-dependent methyltransferase [Streptomyces finlayi]GHA07163.1 SAM-dependent methyltransferase [Streptomyces spiroverticillatus]GHC90590.1 SAM-dependent methyltransferase [Streptomyces finlayi]
MTRPLKRFLRALDRFHAERPWDHNAHYHPWILRQLPARFGSALDIGCGSGDLVRSLAVRGGTVRGVDSDAGIVERARKLTPPELPVSYAVGDAVKELPPGPYDVITCVAVLHHLPFREALEVFAERLAPGGTLVVVGCAREESAADYAYGLASLPANVVMALVRNKGRKVVRPASMTAPVRAPDMGFARIAGEARALLPGARLRRGLFWRYTLVWRKP